MSEKRHGIDQDLIRQLAALLKETELSEIEIEQDDFRIRVSRAGGGRGTRAESAPVQEATGLPSAPAAPEPLALDPVRHPGCIPSPMVGTVFRAPEPGAKPFVDVGDTVRAGQTILIVEAMKHMNEVTAPKAGRVTRIMVEDNQPVEFGEPLMIVE